MPNGAQWDFEIDGLCVATGCSPTFKFFAWAPMNLV
jgi:hypothetical protein